MKKLLLSFLFLLSAVNGFPQKTLLVEKIGTSQKFYYHSQDYFKFRNKSNDSIIRGRLGSIRDRSLEISGISTVEIPVSDIAIVYKRYSFLTASSFTFVQASIYFFLAITINHLLHNEQVLSKDLLIIDSSCIGAAILCFSFSERRSKIGDHWKIKILDIRVR